MEALDEDFQLAILGSKGKWYDHTVRVANAQPAAAEAPADGTYTCDVTLEGRLWPRHTWKALRP